MATLYGMNGRPKYMVGQTPECLLARPLYQPVCDEAGRDGDGYHGNDQQIAGKQAAKIDTAAIAIAAADLLDKSRAGDDVQQPGQVKQAQLNEHVDHVD